MRKKPWQPWGRAAGVLPLQDISLEFLAGMQYDIHKLEG